MNKHVFILGYNAVDYYSEWFNLTNYSEDTSFYFIDNGQQRLEGTVAEQLKQVYVTSRNIGCSGGWNLICDIAFNYLGLDRVIVGEEDARFSQEVLDALWSQANSHTLATTYNNGFGYALFCMHKDVFNKVGRFDENIMWAGCEDNDYNHRCKLNNITVSNLDIPSSFNGNSTSTDPNSPSHSTAKHNADYVHNKWGNYTYNTPFNGNVPFIFDPLLVAHFGKLNEFPSQTEYKLYTQK